VHQAEPPEHVEQRAEARLGHVEEQEAAGGEADDHRHEVDRLEEGRAPALAAHEQGEPQPEQEQHRRDHQGVLEREHERVAEVRVAERLRVVLESDPGVRAEQRPVGQ
jgi:hypothetical protein